ncbi:MAG: transcription antitermination protein NusB [Alphaproteobacteria bacterium]|nr:transcription antitermination protein NusB [Alphaproteobacteria bacterium]
MTQAPQKNTGGTKELAARLMAVQACYQMLQNGGSPREITREFLEHRTEMEDLDGTPLPQADGALFKRIMIGVEERRIELDEMLYAHIKGREYVKAEGELSGAETPDMIQDGGHFVPAEKTRDIEPLLRSVMMCGICEILMHGNIDHPLIINDYLDITHAFYEKQQVSLVNGVLDSIATLLRTGEKV